VLGRALAKSPADRFPSIETFVEAISATVLISASSPAGPAPATAGATAARGVTRRGRHPVVHVLVIAGVFLATAAFAFAVVTAARLFIG
jgi:hypothetical protein